MASPASLGSEKTGSSPEAEKSESSPESEIECGCPQPKDPPPLSPPSSIPHAHPRKQPHTNTFDSPPPPKRSKSISKKQEQSQKKPQTSNPTPPTSTPRPLPKKSSLETHKAALSQGAFLKTLEFRRKLQKQLEEPWATQHTHAFSSRPPPQHSAYTLYKIREYHLSTLHSQAHLMKSQTHVNALTNARKDMRDWQAFEELEKKYRREYGFPPAMGIGEYFDGTGEVGCQLGSFEWVTRCTVVPNEVEGMGEVGLGLCWLEEHPVLPFLGEGERMSVFRELEEGVREDVLGLERKLKGIE